MVPLDPAEDRLHRSLAGIADVLEDSEEEERPIVDVLGRAQCRDRAVALRVAAAQRRDQCGPELHKSILRDPYAVCGEVLVALRELSLESRQGMAEVVVLQDRGVSNSG